MLHGQRDHHGRELGSLAFVDRDGIGEHDLVEFVEIVGDLSPVKGDDDLALALVKFDDPPDVAVEHVFVVVVSGLDDFVAQPELNPEALDNRFAWTWRIQPLLQHRIHLAGPERPPVHRTKNLDVANRVAAKFFWNPASRQIQDG
jgi:hypothetical protein